jgi:hypothetical protein
VQALVHHRARRRQTHVPRPRTPQLADRGATPPALACLTFAVHLFSPRLPSAPANGRPGAN